MTRNNDFIGLGIDAGGTFTDGVIVDINNGLVLSKSKVPTEKDDLCGSIRLCMNSLDSQLLPNCSIVSISTTFATNAIVERKGARAGIILLGYDEHDSARVQADNRIIVTGRHDVRGNEVVPLDEEGLRTAVRTLIDKMNVEAIAISGMYSVKNPAHEIRAQQIAMSECNLPVVCGHELSMELDAIKRATTAYLNAKLLPVVVNLIKAMEGELAARDIKAPLVVVRSDGSLMSASEALSSPIHTIFSGPAASAIGALYLTGINDAIIVDIGGTTTDILFARDGLVSMSSSGSVVNGFAVSTPSVAGHTTGFGGDSHIRRDIRKRITIGPERVVPICYLSAKWPSIVDDLRKMLNGVPDPLCQPTDFYAKGWAAVPNDISDRERHIIEALESAPKSITDLARISGCEYPSLLSLDRLEKSGAIMRGGLTPTDVLHAVGKLDTWDVEAAKLAVELYASDMGVSADELCEMVMIEIKQKLSRNIVSATLENTANAKDISGKLPSLVELLLNVNSDYMDIKVSATKSIIGIGAPVQAYLPGACAILNTKPVIPPNAEVANAVGAVAGRIVLKTKATISASPEGEYIVHTQLNRKSFTNIDDAVHYAESQIRKILSSRVKEDYPGLRFRYDIDINHRSAQSNDGVVFIESVITGTALCTSISAKVRQPSPGLNL